jgi:hypothetical protein
LPNTGIFYSKDVASGELANLQLIKHGVLNIQFITVVEQELELEPHHYYFLLPTRFSLF